MFDRRGKTTTDEATGRTRQWNSCRTYRASPTSHKVVEQDDGLYLKDSWKRRKARSVRECFATLATRMQRLEFALHPDECNEGGLPEHHRREAIYGAAVGRK
jgi:hypothetical protein